MHYGLHIRPSLVNQRVKVDGRRQLVTTDERLQVEVHLNDLLSRGLVEIFESGDPEGIGPVLISRTHMAPDVRVAPLSVQNAPGGGDTKADVGLIHVSRRPGHARHRRLGRGRGPIRGRVPPVGSAARRSRPATGASSATRRSSGLTLTHIMSPSCHWSKGRYGDAAG